MKIRDIQNFRYFYKTGVRKTEDKNRDENFIGSSISINEETSFGFFDIYHGDKANKEGIEGFLRGFLDMAQDSQAVYEFLQNAVDANSTIFEMYYDDEYFLAFNNGKQFDFEGIRSILNVGVSTKSQDNSSIGKFGIGFKLIHRLVGEESGLEELKKLSGPILFSWAKREQFEELQNFKSDSIINFEKDFYTEINNDKFKFTKNLPWLFKILLTNFPCQPDEKIRDLNYNEISNAFTNNEVSEMSNWIRNKIKIDTSSYTLNNGSLFFLKLGKNKNKSLSIKKIEDGIQFSLSILNNIAATKNKKGITQIKINENIYKPKEIYFEYLKIEFNSEEYKQINPQRRGEDDKSDIEIMIGFMDYETALKEIKGNPNFYLYFPLSEEVHNLNFIIHSTGFYNASQRTNLQGNEKNNSNNDGINKVLLNIIVSKLKLKLQFYVESSLTNPIDRHLFLKIYSNLIFTNKSEENHKNWVNSCLVEPIFEVLKTQIPTKTGYSTNHKNVKIKNSYLNISPIDFGCDDIQWFYWNNEKIDNELIKAVSDSKSEKLYIEKWNIIDLLKYAISKNKIKEINNWIKKLELETSEIFALENKFKKENPNENFKKSNKPYYNFLNEINIHIKDSNFEDLAKIDILKFSDGNFYSFNEIFKNEKLIFNYVKTNKIRFVLQNLRFATSILNIDAKNAKDEYIYSKLNLVIKNKIIEIETFKRISTKLKTNTLTHEEKKNLFLNFKNEDTKFDNVGDETLKNLCLFCNNDGEINPLKELISPTAEIPEWLNNKKINSTEYFKDLSKYLLSDSKEIYEKIVIPFVQTNYTNFNSEAKIKELIQIFKDNISEFFNNYIISSTSNGFSLQLKTNSTYQVSSPDDKTRKFIREHCSGTIYVLPFEFKEYSNENGIIKKDNLYDLIFNSIDVDLHKKELVDIVQYGAKFNLLNTISEFEFSNWIYNIDSYEYKILKIACDLLESNKNKEDFREKVKINVNGSIKSLLEIQPLLDKIKIENKEFLGSDLLPNSDTHSKELNHILNQFVSLDIQLKDILFSLFGLNDNNEEKRVFETLYNDYEELHNVEQLAFIILYASKYDVSIENFKVGTIDNGFWELKYSYYNTEYAFIGQDYVLKPPFNKIGKIIKDFPIKINNTDNEILKEPYFLNNTFICPGIKDNLNESEKIAFLDYLYVEWKFNQENIKTFISENKEKNNIFDILEFNPQNCVFPSEYACENEILPDYIVTWINNITKKIEFLSDLGVWTENSVIVDLRKYFSGEIDSIDNNRFVQEVRFNSNKTNLFNVFEWLKVKEIKLKNDKQFEVFKKIVEVINGNRTNGDLEILENNCNFEILETESKLWKEIESFYIYEFKGEMPKKLMLDEIRDFVFYNYEDGEYLVNGCNIYVNNNNDIQKTLQKVALDSNNNFSTEDSKDIELEQLRKEIKNLKNKDNSKTRGSFGDEGGETLEKTKYYSEVEDYIKGLEESEWSDYLPDLKSLLELSIDQPKDRRILFNKLAKLKLAIETNIRFDIADTEYNKLENGNEKYFVHSARGAFAYIHPTEIMEMKENNYKMALDFGTHKRIKIYYTAEEILELNSNHLLAYQYKKSIEDLFEFCKSNNSKNKHLLIIDKENLGERSKAILSLLNMEDDYQ